MTKVGIRDVSQPNNARGSWRGFAASGAAFARAGAVSECGLGGDDVSGGARSARGGDCAVEGVDFAFDADGAGGVGGRCAGAAGDSPEMGGAGGAGDGGDYSGSLVQHGI